ncbi:hypothetical protein M3P21_07790 [Ruegeria sp. 2012CJ41-6]|uniref:Lipocalin-like domain-containing protein n=1 Tax=Ruegeria spongiae TaxID=2942209 RepID=A0ABT0Q0M9_9RHOB|nr:hypothetical protein [Ruegeria spongiae]MCL6283434.1 hypothetical protein [Ruegeria spongiae]
MTRIKAIGAAALAGTLAMATSAFASDTPDLRGTWSGSHTVAALPNERSDGAPRFNESEWVMEIREQQDNVFWGTSKWSRTSSDQWNEGQMTGTISLDSSGNIAMVESLPGQDREVNGLIDATYEDGKIYADFRSLRSGITYSTVLERVN